MCHHLASQSCMQLANYTKFLKFFMEKIPARHRKKIEKLFENSQVVISTSPIGKDWMDSFLRENENFFGTPYRFKPEVLLFWDFVLGFRSTN